MYIEKILVLCYSSLSIIVSSAIDYANYIYYRPGSFGSYSYTCTGSEDWLVNCSTTVSYCSSYYWWWRDNAVGVRCYGKQTLVGTLIKNIQAICFSHLVTSSCGEGDVRLAGGETGMEGRVEVCHNQTWWAVSSYSYWDFRDATVVCRHLGYPADCKCIIKYTTDYQLLITYICMQVHIPFFTSYFKY